jgi:hypothetical protein
VAEVHIRHKKLRNIEEEKYMSSPFKGGGKGAMPKPEHPLKTKLGILGFSRFLLQVGQHYGAVAMPSIQCSSKVTKRLANEQKCRKKTCCGQRRRSLYQYNYLLRLFTEMTAPQGSTSTYSLNKWLQSGTTCLPM